MKKLLYCLAIALVAATACNKQKQDPEPQDPVLKLVSDEVVNIGTGSEIVTIKFTSTDNWTANADEFITLGTKMGKGGENIELKATVQSVPAGEIGRVGGVVIKAGKLQVGVVIMQGKVFYIVPEELSVGIEGGKAEFQVITNLEYTMKKYDGADEAFPFAPVTYSETTGEGYFTVAANPGYDSRYAYVKFTVPAIQDPVIDEETGEATGETQDHVEKIYVYQEGKAQPAWAVSLPANFDVTNIESDELTHDATASLAFFNGKLLVSDATQIFVVNPQTGAFEGTLNVGDLPVQSITNDDAGNLLLAELGPYGQVFNVYAVAASDTELAAPKNIIHAVNESWAGSHGADKVAARGDVYGNGIITMIYGGLPQYEGRSYGMYWEISGGKAPEAYYNEWNPIVNQPQMIIAPIGEIDPDAWLFYNVWLSNRAAFVPMGTSLSDGFFYCGYDDQYTLFYHNGTDWAATLEVGDWSGSILGMETITWNGKKILAGVGLGYTFEWGAMPSYLWLVDVTTPATPVVLSKATYYGLEDQQVTGGTESSTADVVLQIDGSSLASYFVDSSQGILCKVVYPQL